jgi:hypothetical protein
MARHLELEMQSELSVDYVKAVAGIFQASGYFGDRTVDQLATLIFVGDALGLKPANAVFDLEVKDGAIQYKAAEAFRKAADQVEGLKAEIESKRSGRPRLLNFSGLIALIAAAILIRQITTPRTCRVVGAGFTTCVRASNPIRV